MKKVKILLVSLITCFMFVSLSTMALADEKDLNQEFGEPSVVIGEPSVVIEEIDGFTVAKTEDYELSANTRNIVGKIHGIYKIDEIGLYDGIWQVRCNALAPVNFTWEENGIPLSNVSFSDYKGFAGFTDQFYNGSQQYFILSTGPATGATHTPLKYTGISGPNYGYTWKKYSTTHYGPIWLVQTPWNGL